MNYKSCVVLIFCCEVSKAVTTGTIQCEHLVSSSPLVSLSFDVGATNCSQCSFSGIVEITRLNTSEFYYLDELYGDELMFVLRFVSSSNTDVETTEQFILLQTFF